MPLSAFGGDLRSLFPTIHRYSFLPAVVVLRVARSPYRAHHYLPAGDADTSVYDLEVVTAVPTPKTVSGKIIFPFQSFSTSSPVSSSVPAVAHSLHSADNEAYQAANRQLLSACQCPIYQSWQWLLAATIPWRHFIPRLWGYFGNFDMRVNMTLPANDRELWNGRSDPESELM